MDTLKVKDDSYSSETISEGGTISDNGQSSPISSMNSKAFLLEQSPYPKHIHF